MTPEDAARLIWRQTLAAPEKGYSPVRRWLRQERAREHLEAVAQEGEAARDAVITDLPYAVRWMLGVDMAAHLHDPRCNPEMGCVDSCEVRPRRWFDHAPKMLLDGLRGQAEREARARALWFDQIPQLEFEVLAPWQDITEGDETVFATPARVGVVATISAEMASLDGWPTEPFRAPDYVPPPPPADWISPHNLPPAGGVGGRGFKGPYR